MWIFNVFCSNLRKNDRNWQKGGIRVLESGIWNDLSQRFTRKVLTKDSYETAELFMPKTSAESSIFFSYKFNKFWRILTKFAFLQNVPLFCKFWQFCRILSRATFKFGRIFKKCRNILKMFVLCLFVLTFTKISRFQQKTLKICGILKMFENKSFRKAKKCRKFCKKTSISSKILTKFISNL